MMRDRLTFAMAVGVPIMQLVMFGYAINTDPKGLPTVVVSSDAGPMSRSLLAAMQNTGYFRVDHVLGSEKEADAMIETGQVQFMVVIPSGFTRQLVRGATEVNAGPPSVSRSTVPSGSETRSALDGDLEDIEELEESRGGHNEQRRVHDVVDTFIVEPRCLAEQKGTGDVAKERNAGAADRRPARARVLRADQSLLVE